MILYKHSQTSMKRSRRMWHMHQHCNMWLLWRSKYVRKYRIRMCNYNISCGVCSMVLYVLFENMQIMKCRSLHGSNSSTSRILKRSNIPSSCSCIRSSYLLDIVSCTIITTLSQNLRLRIYCMNEFFICMGCQQCMWRLFYNLPTNHIWILNKKINSILYWSNVRVFYRKQRKSCFIDCFSNILITWFSHHMHTCIQSTQIISNIWWKTSLLSLI